MGSLFAANHQRSVCVRLDHQYATGKPLPRLGGSDFPRSLNAHVDAGLRRRQCAEAPGENDKASSATWERRVAASNLRGLLAQGDCLSASFRSV